MSGEVRGDVGSIAHYGALYNRTLTPVGEAWGLCDVRTKFGSERSLIRSNKSTFLKTPQGGKRFKKTHQNITSHTCPPTVSSSDPCRRLLELHYP
jgi:hypothetical protein